MKRETKEIVASVSRSLTAASISVFPPKSSLVKVDLQIPPLFKSCNSWGCCCFQSSSRRGYYGPRSDGDIGPKSSSPVFPLAGQSSSNPSIKEKKRKVRVGKHQLHDLAPRWSSSSGFSSSSNESGDERGGSEIVDVYPGKRSRLPSFGSAWWRRRF
ncbi:unnamed protein product [Linum trigynum]|uniref:Uncharacterized protein n=1 Tax=Linum trigynum TaxID=586398 RepID=A0AAV2CHZ1_9ROSI